MKPYKQFHIGISISFPVPGVCQDNLHQTAIWQSYLCRHLVNKSSFRCASGGNFPLWRGPGWLTIFTQGRTRRPDSTSDWYWSSYLSWRKTSSVSIFFSPNKLSKSFRARLTATGQWDKVKKKKKRDGNRKRRSERSRGEITKEFHFLLAHMIYY